MVDKNSLVTYTEKELVEMLGPPTSRGPAPASLGIFTDPQTVAHLMSAEQIEWACPNGDAREQKQYCIALTLDASGKAPRYYVTAVCSCHEQALSLTSSRTVYGFNDQAQPRIIAMPTPEWEHGDGPNFEKVLGLLGDHWQIVTVETIEAFPHHTIAVLTAPKELP